MANLGCRCFINSNKQQTKSRFELEVLEPRVLLSADAILVSAVAANAAAHGSVEVHHHENFTQAGTFQDALHYQQTTETSGIFDGVAGEAIHSHVATPVQSETSTAVQNESAAKPDATQNSPAVVQSEVTAKVVAGSPSVVKVATVNPAASPAPNSSSGNVMTQQLTTSLTSANGPPASADATKTPANTSVSSNSSAVSNSKTSASPSVSPVNPSNPQPSDLAYSTSLSSSISAELTLYQDGSVSGSVTKNFGNVSLAGVLNLNSVSVVFNISNNGGTLSGTVSITAASGSLAVGSAVTSTIGAITGTYDIVSHKYSLTMNTINLAFSSFVNISATSATVTYSDSASTTATLTDGTNTSTKAVSLLTVGINNATVFAGVNGPATNAGAIGVKLTGANLALALMSSADGKTYYGIHATNGSVSPVGLPSGITMSATNIDVEVNGSTDGNNVVNFDTTFGAGGLNVATGGITSVNIDYTQKFLEATGTIQLSLNNFVYVTGTLVIESQTVNGVNTTGGSAPVNNVSLLTIGASNVTIFAGIGATTNADGSFNTSAADGVSLTGAGFGLALMNFNGKSYYAVDAKAGSLTGVGLPTGIVMSATAVEVQINSSNDGANVVNFDTSFVSGTGLAVPTGAGTAINLDFTTKFLQVSGTIELSLNNFVYVNGTLVITPQVVDGINITGSSSPVNGVNMLTIGASNVTIFAGIGATTNTDGTLNTSAATGFSMTGAGFGLALLSINGKSYYGVDAKAAALGGVNLPAGIVISATAVEVQINSSNDGTNVVNFDTSFVSGTGLTIATGANSSINLDFTTKYLQVVGTIELSLNNFVYVNGTLAITQQTVNGVNITGSSSAVNNVSMLTIGASNVTIFAGIGATTNADGTLNTAAATGVSLTGAGFGLALLSVNGKSYYGVDAKADSLTGVNLPAGIVISATAVEVQINSSNDGTNVVNFDTSFVSGTGLTVITSSNTSINLDFSAKYLQVVGTIELSLNNFVYIGGSLAITEQTVNGVNVTGSSAPVDNVSMLAIGASNVTIFAGVGATTNTDGTLNTATATGFSITGASFGMALLSVNGKGYYGVDAKAASLSGLNLPVGIVASATAVEVQINGSNDGSNVVNFDSSFTSTTSTNGKGLDVTTGPSSSVNLDFSAKYLQVVGTIELSLNNFVYVNGSLAITEQTVNGVNITGSSTPVDNVSLLTIGASSVTIFAGVGATTNSTGVFDTSAATGFSLTGASFALALLSVNGKSYYGVDAKAASLSGLNLPAGIVASATSVEVQINGSNDGSNVVNFDSSFTSTTSTNGKGLDVATGPGSSINLDFSAKYLQVVGTIELSFSGFIYVSGSMAITEQTVNGVTITGSSTPVDNVATLTIGANAVTIFAGVGGPEKNADGTVANAGAVGVELDNANFALALFNVTGGKTYYGVSASAASLAPVGMPGSVTISATNLLVQINGSNDGSNVVNFDAFNPGTGFNVLTGPTTSQNLDFTGALIQVQGSITLGFGSFINISGGFSYTQTSSEIDINVGHPAFTGAADLSFVVGPTANPYFSATGYLSIVLTSNALTINTASLTVADLKIASLLDVKTLTLTVTDVAINLTTGAMTGVTDANGAHDPILTVTAASATLFPGNSSVTGSVTATTGTGADGLGFQSSFDLSTGKFSILLEQFHLAIGSVFTADATGVLVTYDPASTDPHQQLVKIGTGTLDFKFGSSDIIGSLTNLTIYADGFYFDSVTIAYTGSIGLGSILTVVNPSVTLTNFGVTFAGANTSITETGTLTLVVTSASLNVGSLFAASATNLSISVALDPAHMGNFIITAGTLSLVFAGEVTISATNISINTNPLDSADSANAAAIAADPTADAYFSVTSATASLALGSALSASGTATNFSVIKVGSSVKLREDKGFSVAITVTPGQLNLPTWLGFSIQKFEIKWNDFVNHPDQFILILSASINSISGLPSGVTVSGEISDAVIDTAKLEAGEFPIVSIGSVGGSVSGTLFGMQVNASFVLGIVSFNAENQIVNADGTVTALTTDSQGHVTESTVTSNPDTTVKNSIMYVGVAGGAMIPGVGGVEIYIGFSSLGPLTVYVSAQFPLILDPDTGIAIGGFSGGVIFDYTIPTPGKPQDLATTVISPAGITISQWQMQLRDQTVTQYTASSGGTDLSAAYSQPFVIEAGITLYDAYLTADAFTITGNIAIQINPSSPNSVKIFVSGTATFGASVSFNAYLYADIEVSGATSTVTFMFLLQEPASTPIETIGGALTFGFTDANGVPLTTLPSATTTQVTETTATGSTYTSTQFTAPTVGGFYISIDGFAQFSAFGTLTATVSGSVTLTVTSTFAKLDLSGDLNISTLGDLATATGELVVDYSGGISSLQIYGALKLSTGNAFSKLQNVGLYLDGAATFILNTTNSPQSVKLPDPLNPHDPTKATTYSITDVESFEVLVAGTTAGTFASLDYKVGGTTVLDMQGAFDLKISASTGLTMFADINTLTVGPSGTPFLTLSGFGLFVINDQGFAADMDLSLSAQNITGITLTASFTLVMNTTQTDVLYTIPDGLPAVNIPGLYYTDATHTTTTATVTAYPVTVTSLTIPRGPPQGLLQANGTYATVGATGPYIVITGNGHLKIYSFDLTGFFYFQLSNSSAGLVVSLLVNVSGDLGLGTVNLTGGFQLDSNGVVAVLVASGSTGSPTSYGTGISLQVSSTLAFNSTGSDVTSIGGITLKDGNGNPLTITAHSAEVIASGTMTLSFGGGTLVINGVFSTVIVDTGSGSTAVETTTITAGGTLTATVGGSTLLTMNVSGVMIFISGAGAAHPGMAGELTVTAGGSNPLSGNGFSFNGTFDLEVNTTLASQNVMVGTNSVTISAGPNNSTTGSAYAEIHAHGNLIFGTATNGFLLNNGDLYLVVGTSGIAVSASATMVVEVGGTALVSVGASAAMFISSSGFAATLTVTTTMNDPSGEYGFNGTFVLQVNTTGVQQTIGSVTIPAGPGSTGSPAGAYFQMHITGDLVVGGTDTTVNTGLFLHGDFYLTVSSAGLAVTAASTLSLKVAGSNIFTFTANGALLITSSGIAAKISLTISGGSQSSSFGVGVTFLLELNSTGSAISTINNVSVNLPATSFFEVIASGNLNVAGVTLSGSFTLTVDSSGVEVVASASLNLFGNYFTVSGGAGFYSNGFALAVNLQLGNSSTPQVTIISGVLTLTGSFQLQINTTGVTHTFGSITVLGTTTFDVAVNASFNVLGFSMASAAFDIKLSSGVFSASGNVNFDFFGFVTLNVAFYFDSAGKYTFTGSIYVQVGSSGFNIHGQLTLVFSNQPGHPNFELDVNGGVTAFGITNIISADVNVTISGSSVDMSVWAGIHISLPWPLPDINIGGTVHIHLGSLNQPTPPPPPPLGHVSSGNITVDGVTYGTGTLALNLGSLVSNRGVPAQTDENYQIWQDANGIEVLAPGISSTTETYTGVNEIVVPNAGTSNVVIQIDSSVTVPVVIFAGTGSNQFYLGSGTTTVTGSSGTDYVQGGTGNVTFNAGSGTSTFIGGGTGSTHNVVNDPGAVTVLQSSSSYYALSSTTTTQQTLTYGNGTNNNTTQLNGSSITVSLTGVSSGAQTFTSTDYTGTVLFNAAGNTTVTTSITQSSGSLSLNGNVVTETGTVQGTITLNNSSAYGPLNLYGGAGANTLTINSWTGGAVTLDGKGGADTYNVNFQSSGSFNASVNDSGSSGTDVLNINGTSSGATVNLSGSAVSLGTQTVSYANIENLVVNTQSNNEIVAITGTSAATLVNTGAFSNDTINIGNSGNTLNAVLSALTVTGNGTATMNLTDTGDTTANTGTLTTTTLSGFFGTNGSLTYTGVATFNLNLGSGGNTLTVQGGAGATNINTGSGNDTINVQGMSGTMNINTGIGTNTVTLGSNAPAASGVMKNIKGALTITGGGVTNLIADDTGNTAAATGTLTSSTLTGLGMAGSGVTYSGVTTLTISLGNGGNTFTISSTKNTTPTTLNSGAGNDIINLTSDSSVTTINGQAGNDTVNVTNDSATTTINGNAGNDTINIQKTGAATNVNTGAGVNTVNVGSKTPMTAGVVNNIQGAIVVVGNNADTLNVDDTGSTAAKTGLLTSSALTGLNMVAAGITYSGLATFNISLGSGGDTFNVQSTNAITVTTVNTGTGTNTVHVGSTAPAGSGLASGIQGKLIVTGQGTDTLTLDDTGDAAAGTLTQTATTLTGLGMGASGIQYASIETLNINLGAHNNIVYIQGNPAVTTENLNTGSGTNIISIGSAALSTITTDPNTGNATNTGSVLDNVQGIINITGSGHDTLNVDDSGSTVGESGGLWANKLRFLDPVTINFTGISAINISLSEGDDQFAVSDTITSTSTTPVIIIDGNGGEDTFVIFDTHAVMTVNGGDGDDNFYNFGNSAVLNLNGNADDDTFYVYASVSENTSNVDAGAADSNGNQIFSYRVNAAVNINGGSGNDKVFIYATVLNDVIIINGTHVTGAGVDVSFTNIEQLVVAGLGGDDTFYIESVTVPTTVIGDGTIVLPAVADLLNALGLTLPDLTGGAPAPTSFNDTFYVGWQGVSYIPGLLSAFTAPLTIYGDNGPNLDNTTTNTANTVDTIYVDDSGDAASRNFTLTATTLSGTGFGVGGSLIYDSAVENLNFYTGAGNNTITVNGNGTASQTSLYGGRGNDSFIVNYGSILSPLAIIGGTNTFVGDTLTINGGVAGNTFDITGFTVDGEGATISYQEIEKLTINAGGATTFNVNGDSIPTYLNGGSANDTFNVNSNTVSLTLDGGAGADTFVINANSSSLVATGDAGNDTFIVNGNSSTLTLSGGADNDSFTINANSSTLVANGDAGNDNFTVNAISSPATLNGGAGNDSFTVNTPLAAVLSVNGGGDLGDLLTVNGTTGNDYFVITGSTVNGVGAAINYTATNNLTVNGVAGNDTFKIASDSVNTIINGGVGNDLFYVLTTNGNTTVNTGGGINVVDIGSNEPYSNGNILDGIQGAVTVNGGNQDVLNIDDSASTTGKTGTLTATTLNGLAMGAGGISYFGIPVLNLLLGLGNDTLNIQSTNATTVTKVNTGTGANTINVGSLAAAVGGVVNNIAGALILVGSGNDTLNVDDTGSTTAKTGTLNATTLLGLGMGASGIAYSGLAALNISLGSGGNNFTVTTTFAATATTLNSGTGNDVVNLTTDAGTTIINGQSGNDVINITNDGATTTINAGDGNDTVNLANDSATTNINGGNNNDTINILATGAATTVNTGTGINTVNVGSLSPAVGGIVDNIQGALIVVGSGSDTLNVDDTGSTISKTGTLTATQLSFLGMGLSGIVYSGLANLNISLGSGGNIFAIDSTNVITVTTLNSGNNNDIVYLLSDANTTNINSQGGNDTIYIQATSALTTVNTGTGVNTVNVGSLEPAVGGVVDHIQGVLILVGSGSDTLNVDDTGSTMAKTGTLAAATLTGLGMGVSGITYTGLATLNISLGSGGNTFTITNTNAATVTTLNSGSGADTVNLLSDAGVTNVNGQGGNDVINVQTINGTTTVNTGAGTNTVNVGMASPAGGIVDNIQGALTVIGSGADTMNVDDTGSTIAKTGTLTATTLTGLGMGASGITYSGLAVLKISLGSGNDTFNVQSTYTTTVTTLNTGAGTNTVNVGSLAPAVGGIVDNIQGSLIIVGSGHDTLNVDDTGSTVSKTGTLTSTTLTGLAMGINGITYSGLTILNISLGSGGNTFTIISTFATTVTTLNSGSGSDTITVVTDAGVTNINSQGGSDVINIQATSATTTVNTGMGVNTVNVGSLASAVGGVVNNIQGALIIVGNGSDTMNVDDTGSTIAKTGTLTATTLTGLGMGASGITYSSLANLNISLGSGGNTFTIITTASATVTTLNSGSGDDTVKLVTDAGVTNINGQAGNDVINIQATGATTMVNTGSGVNTVNVGSHAPAVSGVVNIIQGALIVVGDNSDTLNVDDTGSTTAKTGWLTSTTITGLAMGASGITYSGLATLNISLGSGNDTFNVQSTYVTTLTTLNTGAGTNIVNVGSLAPAVGGIVDNIQGALIVVGSGGDTLNVDDTGSTISKTGTLTSTTITGLAMGANGITYSGLSKLNISLGSGGNTFTIASTAHSTLPGILTTLNSGSGDDTVNLLGNSSVTNINAQGGNDVINVQATGALTTVNTGTGVNTVNVGSLAPATGGILTILAKLEIVGNGADTLNVDDTGNTTAKTGTLTATTIIGLNMYPLGIAYSGLANLNISLGSGGNNFTISNTNAATVTTLNSGSGNDAVKLVTDAGVTNINGQAGNDLIDIQATGATTTVNTGSGVNTVNVGTLMPTLGGVVNNIQGALIVVGDNSDTLNVDDSGSINSKTGTLTNSTITGLGMGASGITYSGLANLNISLGAGSDTMNIQSTNAITLTTLNTGAGTNTINVGSLVPTLGGIVDNIQGALVIAGSGNDTLNVDDSGSTLAKTGTLTSTTLTGLAMGAGGITYSGLANLNIALGGGGDIFTVSSTATATTRIQSGAGNDTFNIRATTGALYLNGDGGNNVFNFGSAAPGVGGTVNNIAGAVFITGGSNYLRMIDLTIPGTNTVNVDDTGDTAANTGTLTASSLTGLGLGAGITFVAVNTMNISLGAGSDTMNIQSTNATTVTTLNTGAGVNTVNVGSQAPTVGGIVDNIQGVLIVVGNGADTLNVDDTGSTISKTGVLTATTLTGLGLGANGIIYNGLANLNLTLGSGGNTFTISSTAAAATTRIHSGSGNDTFNTQATTGALYLSGDGGNNIFNFGSLAPGVGGTLNNIQGAVFVTGGNNYLRMINLTSPGTNTVNVDDTGDTAANTGTLTASSLTGLGLGAGITFVAVNTMNVALGSGNDTFNVTGLSNSVVTTIDGRAGTNKAILSFSGNFLGTLTLLNFATATVNTVGDFGGILNDAGAIPTVTIGGSLTVAGVLNAGSIDTMTVSGDLAGLVNVTGLLNTLTVLGGTPGKIVAGDVNVITVLAGYGNKVLQVIEAGIERDILATPVLGGTLPNTVHFAFVYDSKTVATPQLAIRITDTNPSARSFNLALVVANSSTAKFNLSRIDSTANGVTGLSNLSLQGDLLMQLSAPEWQLFTDLNAGSRAGVVLPSDSITGVEISGTLPQGFIDVAGIEGVAFGTLVTTAGATISVANVLGSASNIQVLWNLLGSNVTLNLATDAFVVPFNETLSVRLFAHTNTNPDMNLVMTLADQLNDNLPVTAYVQIVPVNNATTNPLVQSVTLVGNGGSINSPLSIANITTTGSLGDVTITAPTSSTVNNAIGLGNVTAASIIGSINVTVAGIYGVIQTTSGDIGQTTIGTGNTITGVTSITSNGALTGQIISRGNLVSSVKANGAFSGVIAAQGDIGVIQRDSNGNAVLTANALTRFGGVTIAGADSGHVIALGNIFGSITVSGSMTGRIAALGQAVLGLAATRNGILGNVTATSFAAGAVIVSGGLIGDAVGNTLVKLGTTAAGFVAAKGAINLSATTIAATNSLANQTGANASFISGLFTNASSPLVFDTGGNLAGLVLIETDLNNLRDTAGTLSGAIS